MTNPTEVCTCTCRHCGGQIRFAYWLAWVCGIFPLSFGLLVFLLWLPTHWQWLQWAGIMALYGGVLISLLGAIALLIHVWQTHRLPIENRHRFWRNNAACAALIVLNYAAAAGVLWCVAYIID